MIDIGKQQESIEQGVQISEIKVTFDTFHFSELEATVFLGLCPEEVRSVKGLEIEAVSLRMKRKDYDDVMHNMSMTKTQVEPIIQRMEVMPSPLLIDVVETLDQLQQSKTQITLFSSAMRLAWVSEKMRRFASLEPETLESVVMLMERCKFVFYAKFGKPVTDSLFEVLSRATLDEQECSDRSVLDMAIFIDKLVECIPSIYRKIESVVEIQSKVVDKRKRVTLIDHIEKRFSNV